MLNESVASSEMRNDVAAQADDVRQLEWPADLHVAPIWSGVSASTPAMLHRLDDYRHAQPGSCDNWLTRLSVCAEQLLADWPTADAADIARHLTEYGDLLTEFDAAAAIGIWSAPHTELRAMADRFAVGYKTSGAGGGDFGLAFTADRDRLEAFRAHVDAHFMAQPAALGWCLDGLRYED